MQTAELGFRAHSGWAAMVALAGSQAAPYLIRRGRIALTDGSQRGAVQPYHAAQTMPIGDAEEYLRAFSNMAAEVAHKSLRESITALADYRVTGAGVLLSSARELPGLDRILASHALIHTAEGEFYRTAVRDACRRCGLNVSGIKERDLEPEAARWTGISEPDLQCAIAGFGKARDRPGVRITSWHRSLRGSL